jgi:peptide chain release factor 2
VGSNPTSGLAKPVGMKELEEKIKELEKESQNLKQGFQLEKKKKELIDLGKESAKPDFWDNQEKARKTTRRISELEEEITVLEEITRRVRDIKDMIKIIAEGSEDFKSLEIEYQGLKKKIEKEKRKIFLSGKYDRSGAIITISSGAGGRDAEDWTAMLLRMYQKYCQTQSFETKIISQNFGEGGGPEGRIGIKEVSLEVIGLYAYGFLKNEYGIHRLVRISPFSSQSLRHTSFAKVTVLPVLAQSDFSEVRIKPEDLRIETFRASGPGGQYVNKRDSAVRVIHLPTGLRASSQSERLQGLNKEKAIQVLGSKLVQMKEEEQKKEIENIKNKRESKLTGQKDKNLSASWGSQRRSYILHPYRLCKDSQTGLETSQVESVLDGDIDDFIEEEIKKFS